MDPWLWRKVCLICGVLAKRLFQQSYHLCSMAFMRWNGAYANEPKISHFPRNLVLEIRIRYQCKSRVHSGTSRVLGKGEGRKFFFFGF